MLANGPKCPGHRTIPRVTPETRNYSLRQDTMVGREKIVSVFPLLYYIFMCECVLCGGGGRKRSLSKFSKMTWIGLGIFVLMKGHHLSSTTDFTRQHALNPSTPANRPNPLSFTPPNGRDWKNKQGIFCSVWTTITQGWVRPK